MTTIPASPPDRASEPDQWRDFMKFVLGQAFSPSAPVTTADLFAKRGALMDELIDVVHHVGQHAVIFGERGVGKTSFISVMASIYSNVLLTGRTNCTSDESYSAIWRQVFDSIRVALDTPTSGFSTRQGGRTTERVVTVTELLQGNVTITPDIVRRTLTMLSQSGRIVVFFDEFDRVTDQATKRKFADTIKALSDYGVRATVVLVGVADSVSDLITEHESINRALIQLHLPRMTSAELGEIVDKGLAWLGMTIEPGARDRIIRLSRGLPYFTHLLAMHSASNAIKDLRVLVEDGDVARAIEVAIKRAYAHLTAMYQRAAWTTRETNYEQVLLACALAPVDDRGYFAPADVRAPLSRIMGKKYDIPNFISNLNQLATDARGAVLQKTGVPRSFRYRFRDPLLQPYVALRGVEKGLIDEAYVL